LTSPSNYVVRDIVTDANGLARLQMSGGALEVIDGGAYGFRTTIELGNGDSDALTSISSFVPCVPGTSIAAAFDFLVVRSPGPDTIRIRVSDADVHAVATDRPITGKPRVRVLSRGQGVTIANATGLVLVDFRNQPIDAARSLIERHELQNWWGWIWSKKSYAVWTTVAANPETPTADLLAQQFTTRATGAAPAGIIGTSAANVCTLDGLAGLSGDTLQGVLLPNTTVLQIANTDVASGTFSWCIGVRG
jgi:hypothetical protein